MEQPTPAVTAADVERIVCRDYAPEVIAAVLGVLAEYGVAEWQREPDRVRLAALKLAERRLDDLRRQIELAICDYRDVLASAEYPGYMRNWSRVEKLPQAERDKIIAADWSQYNTWIKKS